VTTEVSRPPGIAAAGMIKIAAGFGAAAAECADLDGAQRKFRLAQQMTQAPIVIPIMTITAGSGTLAATDQSGPNTGFYWSVRRLQFQGFTAGSVIGYKNGLFSGTTLVGTPEVVAPAAQAGVSTFGRGEILLNPNDWLAFTASGITLAAGYAGVLIQGSADSFPAWLLPEYLM